MGLHFKNNTLCVTEHISFYSVERDLYNPLLPLPLSPKIGTIRLAALTNKDGQFPFLHLCTITVTAVIIVTLPYLIPPSPTPKFVLKPTLDTDHFSHLTSSQSPYKSKERPPHSFFHSLTKEVAHTTKTFKILITSTSMPPLQKLLSR